MRRRLSTVLTFLSLFLCVATAAVWVRSLTTADALSRSTPTTMNGRYARTECYVVSGYGFLQFIREDRVPVDDASAKWLRDLDNHSRLGWSFAPIDAYPFSWNGFAGGLRRMGIFSGSSGRFGSRTIRQWKLVEVPDWLVLLVVSLPAMTAMIRRIRASKKRSRAGFPVVVERRP